MNLKIKKINIHENKTHTIDIQVDSQEHEYVICGGIVCHNSTIAAGTTNGVYPIRDFDLNKTNDTNAVKWVAPDSTSHREDYELAWDIHWKDMVHCYGVMQKWTDQGISADLWRKVQGDQKIGSAEIVEGYLEMVRVGMKTRYYLNSLTAKGVNINTEIPDEPIPEDESVCEACSL